MPTQPDYSKWDNESLLARYFDKSYQLLGLLILVEALDPMGEDFKNAINSLADETRYLGRELIARGIMIPSLEDGI